MDAIQVIVTSSSKDEISTASVWDVYNGTLLARYKGGGFSSPHGLCYGGGYLLSCERGKPMLHLWQINKQHCENKRLIVPGKITSIAFSSDWLHVAVAIDEKVHLYQTSSGRLLGIGARHFQPVCVMKFSDDSTLLCCGGDDGLVTIWNIGTFCSSDNPEPFLSFSEHTLPITDLIFSSGNIRSRAMSVSIDRTCKIYDLVSGKIVLSIVFEVQLTAIALSPVELELYIGNHVGDIHDFSLSAPPRMIEVHAAKSENSPIFSGHEKAVTCLVCTIDCRHIVSGSQDETIKIWHISSRQCLRTIPCKGSITNVLCALLPKSVFAHNFKPKALIHDFVNPANIEDDEDRTVDIMIDEDLLPPLPQEFQNLNISSVDVISYKEEINKLKSINNTMYNYAVNSILKLSKPSLKNKPGTSSHSPLKKRKRK